MSPPGRPKGEYRSAEHEGSLTSQLPSRAHPDDHVPSPCISVCVVLQPARLCIGCFRTLDEIAEWSLLDTAAKRAVLAMLPARRRALGFPDVATQAITDADR